MKIRPYRNSDQDEVIDLWNRCKLVVQQNDPVKDINRKLEVDSDLFLIGIISGKVVASVMGGYEGHRGWINYLAVSPDYRRNGYASLLLQEVEERLSKKGCPKINLQVRESNADVIAFYKSLGYRNDNVISFGKRLEFDDPSNG